MIVVIVQARLGSKRLPGKVLKPIAGRPMLSYVLERCLQAHRPKWTVLAIPGQDESKITKALDVTSDRLKIISYDGNPNDVASRFRHVLGELGKRELPTAFVRVCADSPLIDHTLIDWMLSQYTGGLLTNIQPRTFPHGQCLEIMDSKGFMNLRGTFRPTEKYDLEHVMPWFYRNCRYVNVPNPLGDFSRAPSMVVDTQDDFDRISGVIEGMIRPHATYGWQELVEMLA